jgi:hypothetical protein
VNVSSTANDQRLQRRAIAPLPNVIGLGGAIAGLGGGLAMAIVAAMLTRALGQDIWHQPKVIASLVYGPGATAQPGFVAGPVLVGTLIHLAVSALLGALFGIGTRRILLLPSDFGTPVMAGLVYGLLIWLVAYFIVVPTLSPRLLEIYVPAFIVQHIIYGTVTGLLYSLLRPQPYSLPSRDERR